MNAHERDAWRRLIELGAAEITLGGKPALDLRTCRPRGARGRAAERWWSDFIGAVINVAGRSGTVRRHVDRRGNPVFAAVWAAATIGRDLTIGEEVLLGREAQEAVWDVIRHKRWADKEEE